MIKKILDIIIFVIKSFENIKKYKKEKMIDESIKNKDKNSLNDIINNAIK